VRRPDEAESSYREAARLQPTLAEAWNNLGSLHLGRGAWEAAIEHCGHAIALRADYIDARNNRGVALVQRGQLGEAEREFLDVLRLQPGNATALRNLGSTLKHQGRHEEALACYRAALEITPRDATLRSDYLLALNYLQGQAPGALFEAHAEWGQLQGATSLPIQPLQDPDPGRPLHIGYVSADFYDHSVAHFIEPLLAEHDREAFIVHCYADVVLEDAVTARLRALPLHWHSIAGLGDTEVAERVRHDRIDILVDLAGHTGGNRLALFAQRPAPVQVTYLGYPNTTGVPAIDYRLTDAIADPPGSEAFHTETLVRLEHGFLCYQGDPDLASAVEPPVLRHGHPTFGSFNNLAKITPEVIAVWARLLMALPAARLVLKNKSLRDAGVRQHLLEAFAAHGVVAERLELIGWLADPADHLRLYDRIDVALDTFPYNGTTTTCEALWMGVPVITVRGDRHAARVSASLLQRVGLEDLVAGDLEDYARRAIMLAEDVPRLAGLRAGLRARMQQSPLCDRQGFARELEAAYRKMWQWRCEQARQEP
jgi:predicted O-linked N-acetylglucosamine transferase (SPINDLY family)